MKTIKDIISEVYTNLGKEELLKERFFSLKLNKSDELIKITDIFDIKYTPIANYRFLCLLPGIDCFFTKSVNIPKLDVINGKLTSKDNIKICFYDSIAPSLKQQLYELCKHLENYENDDKCLVVKQLDACGAIISKVVFTNIIIKHISLLNDLSYTSKTISEIEIEISFEEMIVEY